MYVANLQQTIHNCQDSIYTESMSNFDAARFAEFLTEAWRKSPFKSHSELAIAAKLQRATVSSLMSAKPQTATNKPSQPRTETVVALAEALGLDIDQALLWAGHAPMSGHSSLQGASSFDLGDKARIALLDKNLSPEDAVEIAEEMAIAYEVVMARRKAKAERLNTK